MSRFIRVETWHKGDTEHIVVAIDCILCVMPTDYGSRIVFKQGENMDEVECNDSPSVVYELTRKAEEEPAGQLIKWDDEAGLWVKPKE